MSFSFSPTGNSHPPSSGLSPSGIPCKGRRKGLHSLADESEDGYSSHPSIYSASPVGSSDSVYHIPKDSPNPRDKPGIFEHDVETDPDNGSDLAARRNYSAFSGLSLLDTISEQKSASTRSVEDTDACRDGSEAAEGLELDSSDDEYDYRYGRAGYYEYASPTQPLHPTWSQLQEAAPRDLDAFHYQASGVPMMAGFFSRSPSAMYQHSPPPPPPRPTFRPVVSMNRSYGTLTAHPFHRAPVADGAASTGEATPDEIDSPNRSRIGFGTGDGGWKRFVKGCCMVCCCTILTDEHQLP